MYVSTTLEKNFKDREQRVLDLITSAGIPFTAVGIFGSYARGDYKTNSDIDFCIIVDERPARSITGVLRDDAEEFGAEIVFVTPQYFEQDQSPFAKNLRRDFRRLL